MAKIEIKDVTYVYGKGTPYEMKALDRVSITFESNMITGLIGHTGSGKSTLVQMLNGLLRPDSGEVLLDGKSIWAEPKKISNIRFKVGLVMQYPEYQLFEETVEKDISFGPKNMKLSDSEIAERVREAASFTGIPDEMLPRSPFDLSGGQKRRVAIAGVLAMRPEVIVLDEPAAGLDPMGRKEILGGLVNYRDRTGAAIVIVSHNMEDMANYCDKIIVLKESKEAFAGTPAQVFSRRAELEENGLDVPDTVKLADELRARGIPIKGDICTPDALAAELSSILGYSGREGE